MQAKLWVVATPLGNLGDFSPRAAEVLQGAGLILAEDTRRAGLLFQRLGLTHGRMVSSFDHNESSRIGLVLSTLEQGEHVALISDAGTPLIADPGFPLVRACRDAGFAVSPVPGPCAPIAALMASGLPTTPFTFLGFMPRKGSDIRATLEPFARLKTTLVFFERKNRLLQSLRVAFETLGPRNYCVARELTKTHEEFIFGLLPLDQDADLDSLLGECTVLIAPGEEPARTDEGDVVRMIQEEYLRGGRPRDVAKRVCARVAGWTAKDVYALLQRI
jgi:16S rRNA (cytidine1402-2'-O)-methyltransferase